jgi:hypothetical protein
MMGDNALDRLYETLNDLHSGDIDSFRKRAIDSFRQVASLFKEQEKRIRNQANTIISLEEDVRQMKKRLSSLMEEFSEPV